STAISLSLATSTGISASLPARPGPAHRLRGPGLLHALPPLLGVVPALVGIHDVTDQPVPDDVGAGEVGEVDVVDAVEDVPDDPQAALRAAGQVDLGDVTGDHDLRPEPQPGEEHLHL